MNVAVADGVAVGVNVAVAVAVLEAVADAVIVNVAVGIAVLITPVAAGIMVFSGNVAVNRIAEVGGSVAVVDGV